MVHLWWYCDDFEANDVRVQAPALLQPACMGWSLVEDRIRLVGALRFLAAGREGEKLPGTGGGLTCAGVAGR